MANGPFAEAQIGCDDHAGAFVWLAEEMEQQRAARRAERQLSQLVEDHQVGFHQRLGDLSSLSQGLFLFQRIHQLDSREEAHALAVVLVVSRIFRTLEHATAAPWD
jgi:cob(I)alamin adenosyltransferase